MQTVSTFLEDLSKTSPKLNAIVRKCRELMKSTHPDAAERIIYGGIMFTIGGEDVGGIFPYSKHASFEFSRGTGLADPAGRLEGSGKHRRHLKLMSEEDIESKKLSMYIEQIG